MKDTNDDQGKNLKPPADPVNRPFGPYYDCSDGHFKVKLRNGQKVDVCVLYGVDACDRTSILK